MNDIEEAVKKYIKYFKCETLSSEVIFGPPPEDFCISTYFFNGYKITIGVKKIEKVEP